MARRVRRNPHGWRAGQQSYIYHWQRNFQELSREQEGEVSEQMLYKVLGPDDRPCNGGSGEYNLPHDGQPGEWMPPIEGELIPCENGYHLCTLAQLPSWLASRIYEAEGRGDHVDGGDKIAYREVRLLRLCAGWNERTARLFACDCAERVLPIYERDYPGDMRPRDAIAVARRFANGEATSRELCAAEAAAGDAARAAARAAAWDAAGAAAGDAAEAAAGAAAWDAAWDAAWAAARAAARAAAWAAAWAAERAWQSERLGELLS